MASARVSLVVVGLPTPHLTSHQFHRGRHVGERLWRHLLVNQIAGSYNGSIALRPGTFEVSFFVILATYRDDPAPVSSELDASGVNPQHYGLYATITASGLWEGTGGPADPFRMTFSQGATLVFLDPQQDTIKTLPAAAGSPVVVGMNVDDRAVGAGTNVIPSESIGTFITGAGGNFQLVFDQPTITAQGATYWPGLPPDGVRARIRADFSNPDILNGTLAGDVVFEFWSRPIVLFPK